MIEAIPDNEVIRLYCDERWSQRRIAKHLGTNHHYICRRLEANNIPITYKNRVLTPRRGYKKKPFTEEHRKHISESQKGHTRNLGRKASKSSLYKNMIAHLAWDVSYEWAARFGDIEKLKFLNKSLSKSLSRPGNDKEFSTELYKQFIEKFYHDPQFNAIYAKWMSTGDKWLRPSLDHILPKSRGGRHNDLANLQFISWLENRAKFNIPPEEWTAIKKQIHEYFC